MLNIAICDDDIHATGKMDTYLHEIARRNFIETEIEVFEDGKELADFIYKGTRFDLIFLDIEMKQEDGITAAKRIRECDKNVLIVYVTSHENHMQESFLVRPFRFLLKPVSIDEFEICFKAAYEEIITEDAYFRYSYQRVKHKIPIKDILYFESNRRKVSIVTLNGSFEAYEKLNSIEKSLKECKASFLRIHQSFLVNYKHVESQAYDFVIMDNGEKLSISEDRRKLISEQYADDQIIGSFMSKLFFGGVIAALRKVFSDDEIKNLPTRYSFMLVLIPLGSIYIMNNIFMLSYHMNDDNANVHSAITVLLLFGINILIFYVYVKLAEDLRLRRTNSVYEQQLELCERHQEERELSLLQVRDVRHNMKNNLVSILAYAENGECKKIIKFVNEIMEEGGMKTSRIINSGNIVIDSLINYWYITAQKEGIDFSIDINIPIRMPFKGADICLILGNLLENAVEAARKVERNKYIRIRMKYDKNNLLLYIVNNYSGELIKDKSNGYKSTKVDSENHGVGLASVHRTVAKYHGVVVTDDSMPEKFLVKVVLYETPK